jgi:hypothetical protein
LSIAANAALISSFSAAGGHVGIQNFVGNTVWTSILGFDPSAGVLTGVNGVSGADPGISTALGLANGFVGFNDGPGLYIDSNFWHQYYDLNFFAAHGYSSYINTSFGTGILLTNQVGAVPNRPHGP